MRFRQSISGKVRKFIKRELMRMRHFRGHGVHSPFVYKIMRDVYMRNTLINKQIHPLYDTLRLDEQLKIEIQNLFTHCLYNSYAIDPHDETKVDMIILTESYHLDRYPSLLTFAQECGTTIVILEPRRTKVDSATTEEIIRSHNSTTIERRKYLLIYNNHLPKQHFTL